MRDILILILIGIISGATMAVIFNSTAKSNTFGNLTTLQIRQISNDPGILKVMHAIPELENQREQLRQDEKRIKERQQQLFKRRKLENAS